MIRLRLVLGLLLSLMLALTQGAAAAGRVQRVGAMEVVLCTGHGGMQTLWLDGRGEPIAPPHDCPDCLPGLLGVAPSCAQIAQPVKHRYTPPIGTTLAADGIRPPSPRARAPPALS